MAGREVDRLKERWTREKQRKEGERVTASPGQRYVESSRVPEEPYALLHVRAHGRHDDEVLLTTLMIERRRRRGGG